MASMAAAIPIQDVVWCRHTIKCQCHQAHNCHSAIFSQCDVPHDVERCQEYTEYKQLKLETSTPVVRTGVYPHMPIAVTTVVKDTFDSVFSNTRYKILCRLFYDSSRHRLRHRPSPTMWRNVFHSTHGPRLPASLSHQVNERRTCY